MCTDHEGIRIRASVPISWTLRYSRNHIILVDCLGPFKFALATSQGILERSSGSCARVTWPRPIQRTNLHSSHSYFTVIRAQRSIAYQAGQAKLSQSSGGHISLKDALDPSTNILYSFIFYYLIFSVHFNL